MNNESNYIEDLKRYKKEFNDYLIEVKNEMANYDENLDSSPWLTFGARSSKLFNLIEKIKMIEEKIQNELESEKIKHNYELIDIISKDKNSFVETLNNVNLFRNEQAGVSFSEILETIKNKYDEPEKAEKENRFVYQPGDLRVSRTQCQLCKFYNLNNEDICRAYPEGKPEEVVNNKVKCEYRRNKDKFVYNQPGELLVARSICDLCKYNNLDNKDKCEFYPDGKPEKVVNKQVMCKYFDDLEYSNNINNIKNDLEINGIDSLKMKYYFKQDNNMLCLLSENDETLKTRVIDKNENISLLRSNLFFEMSGENDITSFSAIMSALIGYELDDNKKLVFISEKNINRLAKNVSNIDIQNITNDLNKLYSDKNLQIRFNFILMHPVCFMIDENNKIATYTKLENISDELLNSLINPETMFIKLDEFVIK